MRTDFLPGVYTVLTSKTGDCYARGKPWHFHININERKKSKLYTSRCLLELLTLLLPPLPGLQETSQGGKLAPTPDGWSVGAGDQGLRAHGGQPLHFLSCKGKI